MTTSPRPARLTVLAGPTAVGKGTVSADIRARYPEVWLSVSTTTRRPRPSEVEGVHYRFVDDATFDRMIVEDAFLEWALVHGRNRYGTPRQPVLDHLAAGQPALLEIDLQGARQVRETMSGARFVFLAPPSWEELSGASSAVARKDRTNVSGDWRPRGSSSPPSPSSTTSSSTTRSRARRTSSFG